MNRVAGAGGLVKRIYIVIYDRGTSGTAHFDCNLLRRYHGSLINLPGPSQVFELLVHPTF